MLLESRHGMASCLVFDVRSDGIDRIYLTVLSADGARPRCKTTSARRRELHWHMRIGETTALDESNGKVDDVRIYNRALTAAEVKQLYKLGGVRITQ